MGVRGESELDEMWLVLGIVAIGLMFQGFSVHVESSFHQIYSAIYIVGGCILLGVSVLSFVASESVSIARERFRLEAPEAYGIAQKERAKAARSAGIAIVGLAAIIIFIFMMQKPS